MSSRSVFHSRSYSGRSRSADPRRSLRSIVTRALHWLMWF